MPEKLVTVAIPTLAADSKLAECVRSLQQQTRRDFEIVVIDNSGAKLARKTLGPGENVRLIENDSNVGFGAAINQAASSSQAAYIATLNDDVVASPEWIAELLAAMEARPDAGMCASQVRLMGQDRLDSAGMLLCRDGSSKQRGHLASPDAYSREQEVLAPSGSAALYRKVMLDQIGGFDEDFFLYCEDTDLGLRARWAGWKCVYAPGAVVHHHYSHTAGRATALKAFYVERNRLFLLVKNFPLRNLIVAPLVSIWRYGWHLAGVFQGQGAAAKFREDGSSGIQMVSLVVRAHFALVQNWSRLWRKRRQIQSGAYLTPSLFGRLLRIYGISAREVARL